MSYQNSVIGNRGSDNKDPKNKQKANTGASAEGVISGNQKPQIIRPQNSANTTPKGPDQGGDSGVKVAAKRAKKIIRKNTSFSDNAIKAAQNMRGMTYLRSGDGKS